MKERRVDLPAEVVELLQHDPELLAVADAIRSQRPRHGRRASAVAVLVAAAVAAALALYAPWTAKGNDVVRRAEEAAGKSATLHLTVSSKRPLAVAVDPESGKVVRAAVAVAATYDTRTETARAVARVGQGMSTTTPQVAAVRDAVGGFASSYRAALEMNDAVVIKETAKIVWVKITTPQGRVYEVALDRRSYRPVLLRVVPKGSSSSVTLDVTDFSGGK
ncbi:MAG TPA: hypothetical protein VIL56_04880 [Gaiellaceae bacterium]|jgi:hypothetical protein